jgi:hypothetical protein
VCESACDAFRVQYIGDFLGFSFCFCVFGLWNKGILAGG